VVRNYRGYLTAKGPAGALPLVHFGALREGVQAAQARLLVVRGIKRFPERAAAWRAVLELQFTQGARHGKLTKAKPNEVQAVTSAELQAGWGPLFDAAGEAQRALDLVEQTRAGIAAAAKRRAAGD
jgi:hypothetical protein